MSSFKIKKPIGASRSKKIVGRGQGTGLGKTSARGSKGQNSRSGGGVRLGFEGGQTPLYRRLPIRGFSNFIFRKNYQIVNLELVEKNYNEGDTVNFDTLFAKGIIKKNNNNVKILGEGVLTKKLTFEVNKISKKAEELIKKSKSIIKLV